LDEKGQCSYSTVPLCRDQRVLPRCDQPPALASDEHVRGDHRVSIIDFRTVDIDGAGGLVRDGDIPGEEGDAPEVIASALVLERAGE
jgi:hypothetical protein